MKAIINGLLYDTEKSKIIFRYDMHNSLHMTEKGNLFMLYQFFGTKRIICADNELLKRWLAENEPDKYIELFGEVEEA